MGTNRWVGGAPSSGSVAQVGTIQITSYNVGTTYKLTMGGLVFSTIAQGTAAATAGALVTAWNASTHPYATGITTANGGTDTITFTADTAGVPFTVTPSVSGGTGTIGSYTATTANKGPNDYNTADNWSLGTVPVNSDDVVFDTSSYGCYWGLDQSAVTPASLVVNQTFLKKIGLNLARFYTTADGETTYSNLAEYRTSYLTYAAVTNGVDIGLTAGASSPNGAGRIKLATGGATTYRVHNTSATPSDTDKPVVLLKPGHSSSVVEVRLAPGGVGIAADAAVETTTVGTVSVTENGSASSRVTVGAGTTITTFKQTGGNNLLRAAATTVTCNGGTLTTEGTGAITTANVGGGTMHSNSTGTITTANVTGGTLDMLASTNARTITTVNVTAGGRFDTNSGYVTITNAIGCTDGVSVRAD